MGSKIAGILSGVISIGKGLIWLAVFLVFFGGIAWVGHITRIQRIPFLEKGPPPLSEKILLCAAKAMQLDGRLTGETSDAVRLKIAESVFTYAKVFKEPVCDVVKNGMTLVPRGFLRKGQSLYIGRGDFYANLVTADEETKVDVELIKKHGLSVESVSSDGPTAYLRKRNLSRIVQDESSQSTLRAIPVIRKEMDSLGLARDEKGETVGVTEFFRQKKKP
jgi:hypothetical protein